MSKKYNFPTKPESPAEKKAPLWRQGKKDGGAKNKEDPEKKVKVSKLHKETFLRPIRFVLWALLILITVRGAVSLTKPDPVNAMRATTQSFMQSFEGKQMLNLEVSAFAQSFAREYLSYAPGDDLEYASRLQVYGPKVFLSSAGQAKEISRCDYAAAYKVELYDENQYDVYVMADVTSTVQTVGPDGATIMPMISTKNVYLKVPIRWSDAGCVVTDMPAFIARPTAAEYPNKSYYGDIVSDQKRAGIEKAMADFFAVYYGDSQSRVDYYLQTPELGTRIRAMNGEYTLDKMLSVDAFQDPVSEGDFIAIAKLKVKDSAGTLFEQRYSVYVTPKDGRYYIKRLDNRVVDLVVPSKTKESSK